MDQPREQGRLKTDVDRCVKCGLCLPECPTYRLARNENESPRGRIALIEGLVNGRLTASRHLVGHLDTCLGCRRCERVCPSQVKYGRLLDEARGILPRRRLPMSSRLVRHPRAMVLAARLARRLPGGLSQPFGTLHQAHNGIKSLPAGPTPGSGLYPAPAHKAGRVALFAGCTGAALQGSVLQAAIDLLNHAGFDVWLPHRAACCGALDLHSGRCAAANESAATVRALFDDDLGAVLSIASGCGTHIDSYEPPLEVAHLDLCRFLLERADLAPADFAPLEQTVLLHTPCTVENVYKGAHWARNLVEKIPGIRVQAVGEIGQCCGAAGDHMLRHPHTAARLRERVLADVADLTGQILLTSNVGCAMHLGAGLRGRGRDVEILHPVEFLARQLQRRNTPT